jgi:hypothetical protein
MRPGRRTAGQWGAAAVLALSLAACDIPASGVVEAGGPASGIPAVVPVYLVRNDALVAVPRTVSDVGEPVTVVEALFQGPTPQERRTNVTTHLPRLQDMVTPAPTPTLAPTPVATPTELFDPRGEGLVQVTSQNGTVTVQFPPDTLKLTALAADQVICTAARAYLLTRRDLDSATVTVNGAVGGPVEGSEEGCPEL